MSGEPTISGQKGGADAVGYTTSGPATKAAKIRKVPSGETVAIELAYQAKQNQQKAAIGSWTLGISTTLAVGIPTMAVLGMALLKGIAVTAAAAALFSNPIGIGIVIGVCVIAAVIGAVKAAKYGTNTAKDVLAPLGIGIVAGVAIPVVLIGCALAIAACCAGGGGGGMHFGGGGGGAALAHAAVGGAHTAAHVAGAAAQVAGNIAVGTTNPWFGWGFGSSGNVYIYEAKPNVGGTDIRTADKPKQLQLKELMNMPPGRKGEALRSQIRHAIQQVKNNLNSQNTEAKLYADQLEQNLDNGDPLNHEAITEFVKSLRSIGLEDIAKGLLALNYAVASERSQENQEHLANMYPIAGSMGLVNKNEA